MRFNAELPDLELEITTLIDKKVVTLKPKKIMNVATVNAIVVKWGVYETVNDAKKEKDKLNNFEVVANELAEIYSVEPSWLMENLDTGTLQDIMNYVTETMSGIKKKLKS